MSIEKKGITGNVSQTGSIEGNLNGGPLSGGGPQLQPDWAEMDENSKAFIKNKELVKVDVLDVLTEVGLVQVVSPDDGMVFTDEMEAILIL